MKQSLSSWKCQLSTELFTKVSRSLLVNTHEIARLIKSDSTSWQLYLESIKTPIILSNLESKRLREVIS